MISRGLFAATILYLAGQSLFRRTSVHAIPHREGEQDGLLTHRYIHINKTRAGTATDITFHYVESGPRNQEHIVFLHGFMDTWRLWRCQLEALCDRYRVIAFDLKGTGESSKNYPLALFPEVHDAGGDYAVATQADELISALNRIGVCRFNLVTLDLGTIIGDVLAGRRPGRILRYIRCQQPLVGHVRSSIRRRPILQGRRSARILALLQLGNRYHTEPRWN